MRVTFTLPKRFTIEVNQPEETKFTALFLCYDELQKHLMLCRFPKSFLDMLNTRKFGQIVIFMFIFFYLI
jgi:hypothetical protein